MICYRLAAWDYIEDRAGTGARLFGGRWNPVGKACLYASEHISLALLEKYVHANHKENMSRIALIQIEIPDALNQIFRTDEKLLKDSWRDDITYSQWIGQQILSDASVIAFTVPSAIVPSERNIILNPEAVAFKKIRFSAPVDFTTDFRLLAHLLS